MTENIYENMYFLSKSLGNRLHPTFIHNKFKQEQKAETNLKE